MSVTKTIAENTSDSSVSSSQRMSWRFTFYSDNVQVVSSEDFRYDGNTISAVIFNNSGRRSKNRAEYDIGLNIKINETQIGTESFKASGKVLFQNTSTNNSYKAFTLTKRSSPYTTLHAYDYWNANNPTTKDIATTIVNSSTFLGTWEQAADETTKHIYSYVTDTSAWTLSGRTLQFGFSPVVDTITVTKNTTKWLKGLTHMFVSVPITYDADATTNTGTAQYGGYVTSIKLEVGSQSNVYTFTEATKPTTTQIIPLYLNASGLFTPKVTVTDSRGLSTTVSLPTIAVIDYEKPSVNMAAVRCDEDGKIDDDGHNALVTATINYMQDEVDLTEPSIDVEDSELTSVASTTTWYTTYTSGSGVSNPISDWATVNDGDTVYGVVDCDFDHSGALSWTEPYNVTMLVEDTEGGMSAPVVQRVPISYYTIDIKARGKEIAFGAPANDDLTNYPNGLFKCGMEAQFNEDITSNKDIHLNGGFDWALDWDGSSVPASGITDLIYVRPAENTSEWAGEIGTQVFADASGQRKAGSVGTYLGARHPNGGANNWLLVYSNPDGTRGYGVSDQAKFREAIGLTTTTFTVSVTASTGTFVQGVGKRYGNVVHLAILVRNTSSVASGSNIFVGTLGSAVPTPATTVTGGSYYGAHAILGSINTSKTVTIRNASSTAVAITGTNNVAVSFTYLV